MATQSKRNDGENQTDTSKAQDAGSGDDLHAPTNDNEAQIQRNMEASAAEAEQRFADHAKAEQARSQG